MKKYLPGLFITLSLLILASSCKDENTGPPEAILFNDTIDWGWELGEWYGGNCFYWWHQSHKGIEDFGDMTASDWTKPSDFSHGRFYMRFEVLEQPTDSAFKIQLGFWQDRDKEGGHSETIASSLYMEGGAGSFLEKDLGTPAEWWNRREDQPVDFKRPGDIYRIGLALWKTDPNCIPMAQGWSNSNACENPEETAMEFFPMKARVTVVAVAAGHTFTGWDNYP